MYWIAKPASTWFLLTGDGPAPTRDLGGGWMGTVKPKPDDDEETIMLVLEMFLTIKANDG